MIATASKPIRKRRQTRARRCTFKNAYTRFFTRVQYGPNLYAGVFAKRLGMDPMGRKASGGDKKFAYGKVIAKLGQVGKISITILDPYCKCTRGQWSLIEGKAGKVDFHVADFILFAVEKQGEKVNYRCTLNQKLKEENRKHEEGHLDNVNSKIKELNALYSGKKPSYVACEEDRKSWVTKYNEWWETEQDHGHPESPHARDAQQLFNEMMKANLCQEMEGSE